MPKPKQHFNFMSKIVRLALASGILFLAAKPLVYAGHDAMAVQAVDESEIKKARGNFLYTDIFDQAFYEEGAQFLRLKDLFKMVTFSEERSWNVNVYDEVPDSAFFTNRHAKQALSRQALMQGPGGASPAPGRLTVISGKAEGVNTGFFVRDSLGKRFLLKFDPIEYPEMASGAEALSARAFYAIGYNVPQYSIVNIQLEDLDVQSGATYYDATGFKKPLKQENISDLLLMINQNRDGSYRASASTFLEGKVKGPFSIDGRRAGDPNDIIPHRYLREIRGLRIFASWLNHFDLRSGNTLDVVEEKDGKNQVVHYLFDFGSTLGSAGYEAKPPYFGHEHIVDWGETFKSIVSLGFRKKPWQQRWDKENRQIKHPSLGYFHNNGFDPGKWKAQEPYHAFKDMTKSDAYWAAKILQSFSDDDVRSLVEAGQYSDAEAREMLVNILTERRDMIVKYWFKRSAPFDEFDLKASGGGLELSFKDFLSEAGSEYIVKFGKSGVEQPSLTPRVAVAANVIDAQGEVFHIFIHAVRPDGARSKRVILKITKASDAFSLVGIRREL